MKKFALGAFGFAIIPAVWFLVAITSTPAEAWAGMPAEGILALVVGVICMVVAGARLGKTWQLKLLFVCLAIAISIVDIWVTLAISMVLAGGGIA